MQLRKMTLMLAVLGAMSMMVTACGDGGRTSADLACTADTDCSGEGEICHPTAGVCVQTCTANTDCPDSAKRCEAVGGANTQKVCKCDTTALCQSDERVSDPENLACSSGVCAPTGTNGPGPTTCSGEGQSTCSYGQYCSSSTCTAVPAPTCENYQNFTARNELGTTGPIIFKASARAAVESYCAPATPKRVRVTISAYSSTPFPQDKDDLNGLFWVRVNGTKQSGPAIVSEGGNNYVVTGTNRERADIVMSFCVAENSETLSLGVYFTGGNFFCYQANY